MSAGPSDPIDDEQPGPWDVGLQPERTTLAWVRTGLALVVVSLLVGRLATGSGAIAVAVSLGGSGTAWVLVTVQSRRYGRMAATLHGGGSPTAPKAALLLVTGVVVLAALALVLVVA